MSQTVSLTLPAVVRVYDYHEFDGLEKHLRKLTGARVRIAEVDAMNPPYYLGVAYLRKDREVKDLIREIEDKYGEDY